MRVTLQGTLFQALQSTLSFSGEAEHSKAESGEPSVVRVPALAVLWLALTAVLRSTPSVGSRLPLSLAGLNPAPYLCSKLPLSLAALMPSVGLRLPLSVANQRSAPSIGSRLPPSGGPALSP